MSKQDPDTTNGSDALVNPPMGSPAEDRPRALRERVSYEGQAGARSSQEQLAIQVLIQFSQMLAGAGEPREVLELLARAAVERVHAGAAAVIEVTPSGANKLAASWCFPGVPDQLFDEAELDGSELAQRLLSGCGGAFRYAHPFPMVRRGGLFGFLVLLFDHAEQLDTVLAQALIDFAATALSSTAQHNELRRSNADLRASLEALERGQKLRALGEMAAGISHDLKNILSPLSLHLQYLQRSVPKEQAEHHTSIASMRQVLKRGLDTVERLRDFSRQSPSSRVELVALDTLIREAVAICMPRTRTHDGAHYSLVVTLGTSPQLMLSASEAVAALVNLIVNAIDAMPSGGAITITSGADSSDSSGWVRVADNGPGMTPDVEERVFQPFFTTKGQQGTGLGLALVYAFVQRHRGQIDLETAPGEGACFTLRFPIPPGGEPA